LRRSLAESDVAVLNIGASNAATQLGFEKGVTSGVFKVAPGGATSGVTNIPCDRLDAIDLRLVTSC
jgi:hypothetical protein